MKESPYFCSRKRPRSKPTTSSPRFDHAPSSAFGSFRPADILFSLTDPKALDDMITSKTLSLNTVVSSASRHFLLCEKFCRRWEKRSILDQCCDEKQWVLAERDLLGASRHLCKYKCYMKAHSAFRDWLRLRMILKESSIESVNRILLGWRYHLCADSETTRTVFVSPNNTSFVGVQSVLNHLKSEGTIDYIDRVTLARRELDFDDETHYQISDTDSPLGLLEEIFHGDPWRLLLSTVFLNRTSRVQVDHILCTFLERWPSVEDVMKAQVEEMSSLIQPLGMRDRRASGIIRLATEFIELRKKKDTSSLCAEDIKGLFHCGDYAVATYRIFIRKSLNVSTDDNTLATYIEYKRGESAPEHNTYVKK